MKDQYFGDINDFRKYCILSKLTKLTRLPICFVWMRTSADVIHHANFFRMACHP
jgi:hypothetical protein